MQKCGERMFSNRKLGIRVYITIVMIMGLNSKLGHIKKSISEDHDVPAPRQS